MEILAKQRILTEMETRYQEHVSIYKNNKNSLEEVEGVLHKLRMMFSSEEEKLDRIILRQSEADKEMSTLLNEKQQIKQDLEELTASISETNEELQLLESKNADINQENKVLEEYVNRKLQEREGYSKEHTDIRIQLATMQQEIRSLKDDTTRMQEDVVRHFNGIKERERQLQHNNNKIEAIQSDTNQNKAEIAQNDKKVLELKSQIAEKEKKRSNDEQELQELEQEIRNWNRTIEELTDKKHRFEVQTSRLEVELENFQNNIWEEYEVTWNSAVKYRDENLGLATINQQIQILRKEIEDLGDVNVSAIEEYKSVSQRFQFMTEQKNDLVSAGKLEKCNN